MEQSKARRKTAYAKLLVVALAASFFAMHSCKDDDFSSANKDHNVTLAFTRAGDTSAEQIPTMRLFTFYNDNAAPNDKMFHGEVLNLARNLSASQVSAQVETGTWNMVLLSTPNGGNIMSPVAGTVMSQLPMYKYQPTTSNGKSSNAHEIFLDNRVTPNITSGGSHNMTAQLNRTVAKVELIIEKTTPNFNLTGTHSIKLHNVPSTLSYTGALLPGKATPDTLSGALRAPVQLQNAGNGSYEGVETISFIIPAHRGADYINYTGTTPNDTTTLKMDVTVDLERVGGTRFAKQAEIPVVAKANMVLRVYITVNDGLEFRTEVLDWQGVPLDMTVGAGYQNWLYVKKGATGNGISWSDALPDISTAITKATALMNAGKTVNGVLVAGGEINVYNESFIITDAVKGIYGGWKGDPGTELPADLDLDAPYKSVARDLKNYKVYVSGGGIQLNGARLDGFVLATNGTQQYDGLLHINNATAVANAIEIEGQTLIQSGKYALKMDAGTAINILCTDNNSGAYIGTTAKLVNATVANNTGTNSEFLGTVQNTVLGWSNIVSNLTIGSNATLQNCTYSHTITIPGSATTAEMYPLGTNVQWFTPGSPYPGPHFNLGMNSSIANYEVGTSTPNRSPMLGRGNQTYFDNNTPFMPPTNKMDINGNARHYEGTDIGCYENGSTKGFKLEWVSDRIYVTYKANYVSEQPLIILDNDTYGIGVAWDVTVIENGSGASSSTLSNTTFNGPTSGSGSGVIVGSIKFTNPTTDYASASERKCGTIRIHTDLGTYLPDTSVEVWQTSGNATKWLAGYVGSFHRNGERGARYISATSSGAWSARIIYGLDWIKIDANNKNFGENITDADEGVTPDGGYYKEVVAARGGVVSGSGNVKFRVGMISKNTTGAPRYGLIIITRGTAVSMFFVRQGEEPDYLYREEDAKPTASYGSRQGKLIKFSPYNITDPQSNAISAGRDLGKNGSVFVKYPSQTGYYFRWNQTTGYQYGGSVSVIIPSTGYSTAWSNDREVCPPGYRHGTHVEFTNTLYYDVADGTPSTNVSPGDANSLKNYELGAYADGWYDQLASDPINSTTGNAPVSSVIGRANKGTLMVNHNNYASLFFPTGGTVQGTNTLSNAAYAMYNTQDRDSRSSRTGSNTHWGNAHIGMSCTPIYTYEAAPVRCVKDE